MKCYPALSLISYIGTQLPCLPPAFSDVVLCCLAPTCAIRGGFHPLLWAFTSASRCAPAASIGTLLQARRGRRPGRSLQAQQAREGFEGLSCYLGQLCACREWLCHCRVVAVGWQGTAGGDVVGPGKLAAQERQDTGCMVVHP